MAFWIIASASNVQLDTVSFNGSVIPEPSTALLAGLSGLGLLGLLRRRMVKEFLIFWVVKWERKSQGNPLLSLFLVYRSPPRPNPRISNW